jgi:hypothetical protein
MAPPFIGFRQANSDSICGLFEGVEEPGENRNLLWKQKRTASGQLDLRIENHLNGFIPKLMSYGQYFSRILTIHVY